MKKLLGVATIIETNIRVFRKIKSDLKDLFEMIEIIYSRRNVGKYNHQ
ncbi:hypothetical protein [Arcticibacter eurypsychrophilus]|nr:hypothetical protein [Arcticibacter eurypsychrophilus]